MQAEAAHVREWNHGMSELVKSILHASQISALLLLVGCHSWPAGNATDDQLRAEIRALNLAMEDCVRAGDMARVATYYADDAVLLGPRGNRVSGRKAQV